MTEPLIVDPERLDSASAILGAAAGKIPTELPKFSSPGKDPLSLAIAVGAIKVEEPMAALPGIKAEATTVAQNIGIAGQRYTATDQLLAERAAQHRFAPTEFKQDGGTQGPPAPSEADKPWWALGKTDAALGGAAGAGGALFEDVAKRTRRAIAAGAETGPGAASPRVKQLVEEIKTPFKVFGKEIPLGTRMGGVFGLALAVPTIAKEVADGQSAAEAIVREGAGFAVGTAIGGAVGTLIPIPVVGTALGVVVGGFVGSEVSNIVDKAWDPAAHVVGKVVDGLASVFHFG